jgi:Protein of unknown function (DUF1559)
MKRRFVNTLPYALLIICGCSMIFAFIGSSGALLFVSSGCGLAAFFLSFALARAKVTSILGLSGPEVCALMSVLILILGIIGFFTINKVRDASVRYHAQKRLRSIGHALLAYADDQDERRLPPAALADKNGKPLLSWRVAILPYLGEKDLYQRFNLDEPWDSPQNRSLIALMPEVFAPPQEALITVPKGMTHCQVLVGPDTAFDCPNGCSITKDFPAGLGTTILLVEAAQPVPWTKPHDVRISVDSPLPSIGFRPSREGHSVFFPVPITRYVVWGDSTVESLAHDALEINEAAFRNGAVTRKVDGVRWRFHR